MKLKSYKNLEEGHFLKHKVREWGILPNFLYVKITGTNGKTSTCIFLKQFFLNHYQKVGLFTSPHLVSETERIQINFASISPQKLEFYFAKLSKNLTFFEKFFLAAIMYFNDCNVDIALFEVGIGARNDCVNIFPSYFSIITSIGHDHGALLGRTKHEIAWNKSFIMKDSQRCFIHSMRKSKQISLIMDQAAKNFHCLLINTSVINLPSSLLKWISSMSIKNNLSIGQQNSLFLAAKIYFHFYSKNFVIPVKIPQIRGRFEIYNQLNNNHTILFDGCHNEESLILFKKTFLAYLQLNQQFSKYNTIFVVFIFKDKCWKKLLALAQKFGSQTFFCYCDSSFKPQISKSNLLSLYPEVSIINNKEFNEIILNKNRKNRLIVVLGSFYLYSKLHQTLNHLNI